MDMRIQEDIAIENEIVNQIEEKETSCHILTDDEKINIAAAYILEQYKPAFEELAK